MTYVINWSSQSPFNNDTGEFAAANIGKTTINITNNTSNGSTTLVLTGQGFSGYGAIQQENFIRLMENFASESAPANPTVGQLWYQTTTQTTMVYNIVTPANNTVTGSVNSGSFSSGENITQAVTGATATLIGTVPSVGPMTLVGNSIVGTPDATHQWSGNSSLATFSPTAAPVFHAATFGWSAIVSPTSISGALGYVPYNPGTNIAGYLTSATGISGLTGTANQVLVNGTSGTPQHGAVTLTLSSTPTFTEVTITNPPVLGTDATNKLYVDTNSQGLNVHPASNYLDDGTGPSQIPGATYTNGSLDANGGHGIGATLSGTGSLTVDGNVVALAQRVVVNIAGGSIRNGIYTLTTASPWVLTRSTDMDDHIENQFVPGDFTFVTSGTKYANSGWSQSALGSGAPNVPAGFPNNANHSIIIGTDAAAFTQFSGQGAFTAGAGLNLIGSQFNNTGVITLSPGAGIMIGGTSTAPIVTATASITGTSNQVFANGTSGSAQVGAVTLTLPQNIGTSSTPSFAGLNFSGGTGAAISPNPLTFGSITLSGSKGSSPPFAGIQFSDTIGNRTFMVSTPATNSTSGLFNIGTGTWDWLFFNGTLTVGNIPAANILAGTASISITGSSGSCTGNAATATTAANCTGNSATATTAANGGVTSVNSRTGAVTISSSDVTSALGFTPASAGAVPSFTASVNGQANFPSGFQMRWGVVSHTVGSTQTHSFSAPFSNACFVVIPTVRNNVGSGVSAGVEFFNIVDGSVNQFGWTQFSNNTCQIEYVAYGN